MSNNNHFEAAASSGLPTLIPGAATREEEKQVLSSRIEEQKNAIKLLHVSREIETAYQTAKVHWFCLREIATLGAS